MTAELIETALRAPVPQAAAASRRLSERAAREGLADLCYAVVVGSPLGDLLLVSSRRGLAMVHYVDGGADVDGALDRLAARRSPRIVESAIANDPWRRELDEYFAGARRRFDAPRLRHCRRRSARSCRAPRRSPRRESSTRIRG